MLVLAALWAGRHLAVAQRIAANDHRAAVAIQAADAGLAWARAMLNTGRLDNTCRPDYNSGRDFRERALRHGPDGDYLAASGDAAAAVCINNGLHRWDCRCDGGTPPANGGTVTSPGTGSGSATPDTTAFQPTFAIRFLPTDAPGQLTLVSRGCSQPADACTDASRPDPEGVGLAEHGQHMALLSALRRPPSQAVTDGNNAFLRVFGYPASQYRLQPALTRLRCSSTCSADLRQAFARGRRLIWIDGGLSLREPLPSPPDNEPVVLLVDGQLDITVAMQFSGVLYARTGIRWTPPTGSRSTVRGALITDGRWTPQDGIDIQLDAELLQRINRQMGSFLPVPGGWSPRR
ncbi:hypothetical protein SAMN05216359_10574 [Roseateles sp. YR242]|uniref:hypothetical protein n=1 Tax=Roseateles sp. YR242 TaxID=1855305 RepID=UPI0008CED992|nr:hypothetical protein [Roseateles sp. YR242]SEL07724.1 hypothetical protein SAMN05216359_10574 [Roseateles sp. YR242]